jgi:outer membrane protein assembly factor BamD (BamD/ComL family)
MRRLAALALAGAFALIAGCGGSVIPQIRSEPERMTVAKQLLASGDESGAISLFKGYIDRNTGASDIDAAIYLLGEAYLRQKEWTSAQLEFERVLRDYPESDSSGSASFRLGDALYGQARGPDFDNEFMQRALTQWMEYRVSFPGHWRQPEGDERIRRVRDQLARKLLANARLYTKLRRVEPARVYYLRVLTEYGDLGLAGEAEIGLALCDRLEGKKAEAIERLQRIEREHSGTPAAAVARKERERTEKMKVKVAKPAKRQIPDVTTPAGAPGAGP